MHVHRSKAGGRSEAEAGEGQAGGREREGKGAASQARGLKRVLSPTARIPPPALLLLSPHLVAVLGKVDHRGAGVGLAGGKGSITLC